LKWIFHNKLLSMFHFSSFSTALTVLQLTVMVETTTVWFSEEG